MKILKYILIGLIGVIAIVLIGALFVKQDFAVEKEITINQPKEEVFNYVKYLKNQDTFSVWATMDPMMKKEYKGTDGTVGFVSAWDSQNKDVGKGEQEIKNLVEGERLDFELRFIKPFEATNFAYMTTEAVSDTQTKIKWGFTGKSAYPMNFMMLFMNMEELIGKDLQKGLENLKVVLEK